MTAPATARALARAEDLPTERAALGAALQGWEELDAVRAELADGAAEFSRPLHQAVYAALLALAAHPDRPPEAADGALLLGKARELAGGERVKLGDLVELMRACPTRLNAAAYARAVHAAYTKRAALVAVDRVARDVADGRPAELVAERAIAELRKLNGRSKPEPVPADPWQPFPLRALPARMRAFVQATAAATDTDPACAALAALVTAAGCIGNRAAVMLRSGWVEPAVLWGAIVGRSGTTKSPVLKLVTRAVLDIYKAERLAFREALRAHSRESEKFKIGLSKWRKAQRAGEDPGPPDDAMPSPPERPIEKRLLVSDITIEKLGELLEQNPLGLLLVRDELAAWLGSFDRYAAGKGADQPAWLSFHDASSVTIDRKTAGSYFIDRAAVSVLGTIQPGTLERVFGAAEREAGLLARVLLVHPPERPAKWTERGLPDEVAAAWRRTLEALLAIEAAVDERGGPKPRYLPIGADAKPAWVAWHNAHASEVAEADSDDLCAALSKLKGGCVRLALVLALVEAAETGRNVGRVDSEALERAIAVTDWLKHEARRVYGMLAERDEDRDRRRLLELVERRGGSISARELVQASRRYRDVAGAEAALSALVDAGAGRWHRPEQAGRGGPKARRFMLAGANGNHEPEPANGANVYRNDPGASAKPNSVGVGAVDAPEFSPNGAPADGDEVPPLSIYNAYPEAEPLANDEGEL